MYIIHLLFESSKIIFISLVDLIALKIRLIYSLQYQKLKKKKEEKSKKLKLLK